MISKRRIINMLRKADENTVEKLSSEYPQAEKQHKEEMYARVKERMESKDNAFTEEVSGVEKYTRRSWMRFVPAAAMSLVLIGGAVGGSVMMLKNSRNVLPAAELDETTTFNSEPAENETSAESKIEQEEKQSDITKDNIFAICENGNINSFDHISYSYEIRYDYDTGYHEEKTGEIRVDNTQNTASEISDNAYYRNDGSLVYKNSATRYTYNGKKAGIIVNDNNDDTDEFNNRKMFFVEENDSMDNVINTGSDDGKKLLENVDDWDIIGTEEYLDRKCAIIRGVSKIVIDYESSPDQEADSDVCTCEYTISIDIQTGVWMKSDIKHTDYDLAHYSFNITDIRYGDNANHPMSKDEFRQLALDDCFKYKDDECDDSHPTFETVNESDLDFLD